MRLSYLVRNAHACAKRNRPLSDYVWLAKLDQAKGLEMGNTYLNDRASIEFMRVISDLELEKTKTLLDNTKFFSFMMDGSQDISGTEQESIYLRFAEKGNIYNKFLHIGSPESTCSKDLHAHVCQTFETTGVIESVSKGNEYRYLINI